MANDEASQRSPWPMWARNTMSAVGGAGAVLVTVTLSFGDVKHDATDAAKDASDVKRMAAAHELRLSELEKRGARDEERWEQVRTALLSLVAMQKDISEIKAKVAAK